MFSDSILILGRAELSKALRTLPAYVALKVFNRWTLQQARAVRDVARRTAPRDRGARRGKSESERLWKTITASPVRKLSKFPKSVARAIAYGSAVRNKAAAISRANKRISRYNARNSAKGTGKSRPLISGLTKRGRHFHLVVRGTEKIRRTKSGRSTGKMWGKTPNPRFWEKATASVLAHASGEVGGSLKVAYMKAMSDHIKSLTRKYK